MFPLAVLGKLDLERYKQFNILVANSFKSPLFFCLFMFSCKR